MPKGDVRNAPECPAEGFAAGPVVADERVYEIYNAAKRKHPVVAELRVAAGAAAGAADADSRGAGSWGGGSRGADSRCAGSPDVSITILPDVSEEELPLMLALFAEDGIREIPAEWARRWIEDRIPPAGRQNIGEILLANGLEEYDPIALFVAGCGRSSHDDFLIREKAPHYEYRLMTFGEGDELDGGPEKELADLGRRLATARKDAGLTQRELAERTGIDQAIISKTERGKGNPTVATLMELASGVGRRLTLV